MKASYVLTLIAGIGSILIGVSVLAGAVLADTAPALSAIGIALLFTALCCWWAIGHVKRTRQPAIDELKLHEPVVYFCAYPMGQELLLISSNKADKELKVWGIRKKKPVLIAKEKLSNVTLVKGDVQLAALRKVSGLEVHTAGDTERILKLALYHDTITAIMPTLKDQDLDTAIERLRKGE